VFGQAISADGLPEDELDANQAVGNHAGLIPLLGTITDAPPGQKGLVMAYIPTDYAPLGKAPDMATLVRDVFGPDQTLDAPALGRLAYDLADTLAYVHSKGVMHGDVYAHNVLGAPGKRAILGDFGCGVVYDPARDDGRRERLDVRGFGYLLDDFLQRLPADSRDKFTQVLAAVRDDCLRLVPAERPLFAEVRQTLQPLTESDR